MFTFSEPYVPRPAESETRLARKEQGEVRERGAWFKQTAFPLCTSLVEGPSGLGSANPLNLIDSAPQEAYSSSVSDTRRPFEETVPLTTTRSDVALCRYYGHATLRASNSRENTEQTNVAYISSLASHLPLETAGAAHRRAHSIPAKAPLRENSTTFGCSNSSAPSSRQCKDSRIPTRPSLPRSLLELDPPLSTGVAAGCISRSAFLWMWLRCQGILINLLLVKSWQTRGADESRR